jgi:ABC-2 type transport system ATP-binding protein
VEATFSGPGSDGPFAGATPVAREAGRSTFAFDDAPHADAAVRAVVAAGGRVAALTEHRETLEDFFLRRLEGAAEAGGVAPARRAG